MAVPQIHVYDINRQRIGVIDDAEELIYTRRWRGMDEWSLKINAHKSNADLLVEDGYIGYYNQGQYRFGLCEYPKLTTGEKQSKDIWEWKGRGPQVLLNRRMLINFLNLGTENDVQTSVTREAAMRHYVNVEAISPYITDLAIPNLVLEADSGRGGTLTADYNGRLQMLDEVCNELSAAGDPDPLGWDILFTPATSPPTGPGTLTFRVRSRRDKSTVKISGEFQTINGSTYEHNLMDYKNYALVGGSGEGTARIFRTVTDGTSPTGAQARVIFVDESSYSTNAELDQQGVARLQDYAAPESVTADYNQHGAFRYIRDFDLGDIVTVVVGKYNLITTITEITETYGTKNTVKLTFGTAKPDMIDFLIRDRKQFRSQIRR
jgi:hypothetical protein